MLFSSWLRDSKRSASRSPAPRPAGSGIFKRSCVVAGAIVAAEALAGQARGAQIVAWGFNGNGNVSDVPSGNDFTAIAGGNDTSYALKTDGSIVAWGYNSVPSGTNFTAIAGGFYTGYALKTDGSIAAWGYDGFGQVSNVPAGNDFAAIAAGGESGYALKTSGSIVAWGYDGDGEVSNVPSGTDFTAIAGGDYTGYALQAVPEPASATLIGIAGLAPLLKRRINPRRRQTKSSSTPAQPAEVA